MEGNMKFSAMKRSFLFIVTVLLLTTTTELNGNRRNEVNEVIHLIS